MKIWQKYWLYLIILFFSYHLIRDILQGLEIHTLISDILVKTGMSKAPAWYWKVFNTYMFEITGLILAILSLKRGKFGLPGYLTIFISLFFLIVWLYYWIFL